MTNDEQMKQAAGAEVKSLLEELADEIGVMGTRREGDVDSEMLAKRIGISVVRAGQILNNKYKNGELEKVKVFENGRLRYVYRKVKK